MCGRLLRIVCIVGALGLPTLSGGAAQAVTELPATPQPSECVVAPRPPEEFKSLLVESLTPTASTPDSSPSSQESFRPSGDEGDEQTVEAVSAIVRLYVACINAGNPSAAYALLTDEYLRQQFAESRHSVDVLGGVDEFLSAMGLDGTPTATIATPLPEWRGALTGIDDVRVLQDGRIGAVITVEVSSEFPTAGIKKNYYIFRSVDGDLLIDDISEAIPEDEVGTPESSE